MFDEIFEWLGELFEGLGEFFGSLFEGVGEFSVIGLLFGILTAGFVFLLRKQMLNPFLVHMSKGAGLFWGALTYIGCFIAGYFIGKFFENS